MKSRTKLSEEELNSSIKFIEDTPFNIGVLSLSQAKDCLSQWRGYGDYAIVFDFNKLNSLLKNRRFKYGLTQCLYEKKDQESATDEFIKNININPTLIGSGSDHLQINIQDYILKTGLAIKNKSFSEELEWRAISEIINSSWNEQHHSWKKEKDQCLYLEFDLSNDNNELPISAIMIGPVQNKESKKLDMEKFLKLLNLNIPVLISTIPYRGKL